MTAALVVSALVVGALAAAASAAPAATGKQQSKLITVGVDAVTGNATLLLFA